MLSLMDRYNTARSNAYFEKTFKDRTNYFTIDLNPLPDFTSDRVLWLCFTGDDLIIFGAAQDLVILNWGTKEIAAKCKAAGKHPTFVNYRLLDHISLGAWLGFQNMVGLNPYRLKGDTAPAS